MTKPNDILALSPTSFFVTNDHYYREGWKRSVEDFVFEAKWSSTLHVELQTGADGDSVNASVALTGLHNNGLGRGRTPWDVLVGSAASGMLHLGTLQDSRRIRVDESIALDSTVDNPSYFSDPWADDALDTSGFVMCGLTRGIALGGHLRDPSVKDGVMVWMVTPSGAHGQRTGHGGDGAGPGGWNKRLLFQDDGGRIRTASSAVLVAADARAVGGRRQARLFVTGFLSKGIVSLGVDL